MYKKNFSILYKISNSTIETKKIGSELVNFINNQKKYKNKKNIILLEGCIGSGKTILTKGIAKKLGIKKNINSPTFLLLKSYKNSENQMHHLDLYKILQFEKSVIISTLEEITEIVKLGDILVIESTQNISYLLPYWNFRIKIEILNIKKRKILIENNKIKNKNK
ncbi:tRNA (adenosine(37)-N6)-threonylcarbamoyltransferase complex ATPase subunit type 1 TsaE [Candidatus Phytoplasma oryzae]|nr:tRNA (adenosine(37)-N6)-threonylcarbamoyltransferase complex ATPase subunit type 1 TsaE [Candidatus Phytoplasma oryzae]